MKTKSYFASLSLSLSLSLLLISSAFTLTAQNQSLFIKNGSAGIGSSTSNNNYNVGINVNNPSTRLDIQTDVHTGGLQIRTAEGNGIGGWNSTPFAFRLAHEYLNQMGNPQIKHTFILSTDGKIQAGDLQGVGGNSFVSTIGAGFGAYYDAQKFVRLNYLNPSTGARINWRTNESNPVRQNFSFAYDGNPLVFLTPSGRVGIGTNSPSAALTIVDNSAANTSGSATYGLQVMNNGWRNEDFAINVNTAMGNVFRLTNNGYLYLGQNLNGEFFGDYRMYVQNGIRTEKIRIDIAADNGWADFVFDDDYELMPIAELRAYIQQYKHLPNVPSAEEVAEEGIDLAEMNAILLRQIEELTLRVIELEEKIGEQ